MKIWIDVENASGRKLGDGPIISAQSWESAPALDAAGTFRFDMPAGDPRTVLLINRLIVRCRGIVGGALADLGRPGIVDTVEDAPGSPSLLRVSGSDLLQELAGQSVRDLAVCEQQWVSQAGGDGYVALLLPADPYPGYSLTNLANCYDADDGTYESFYLESYSSGSLPENARWLYVGRDDMFDRIRFRFAGGVVNTVASTLEAQYFDVASNAWLTVTSLVDGTASGGATMAQDGDVTFDRPANWGRYTALEAGNWRWIRLRVAYAGGQVTTDTFHLGEVYVYADRPTTDGVNLIMAYAPGTWTKSGYPATSKASYQQFQGESVLTALAALAEQTGDHFRESEANGGRQIDWLTSFADSGFRAIRASDALAAEGNDQVVLITDLRRQRDTVGAISRIIPLGADGLTLERTSRSAPAGYTLSASENYIENDSARAAWNVVEETVPFPDVGVQQADSATIHPQLAADALFDRALEHLSRRCVVAHFYELTIGKLAGSLPPGYTIRVIYHEWRELYHSVNIDADLNILGTRIYVDTSGVRTVGLEVANVDRPPETSESVLVSAIYQLRQLLSAVGKMRNPMLRAGDIPLGLTDGAPGRLIAGGAKQFVRVGPSGLPEYATLRRGPVYVYPGAIAVDATPAVIHEVLPGETPTVKQWRLKLGTAGSSNTTVVLALNGITVATVTAGSGQDSAVATLDEDLVGGDALTAQITAAGTGASDLCCTAMFEG